MLHKIFYYRPFLFFIGVFFSFISSLTVLDANSIFWLNDEGLFYNWALENTLDIKNFFDEDPFNTPSIYTLIRYKLFVEIIEIYLSFVQNPLYVVFIHKLIIISIYIFFFAPYIINNVGFLQFILIYISLIYLNLFFLRESLICLMGLSFLLLPQIIFNGYVFKKDKYKLFINKGIKIFSLLSIFFLRPQIVIFFINKKYIYFFSINLIFLSLVYSFYEKGYFSELILLQGESFNSKIHYILYNYLDKLDINHFVKNILFSINGLNPFTKIVYYVNENLILNLILLLLSSLILIFFVYQLILGSFFKKTKIPHSTELIISLSITFFIYALSHIQIDIRIFISALSPFLIYFQPHLLTFKSISLIISILILIVPLKIFFL